MTSSCAQIGPPGAGMGWLRGVAIAFACSWSSLAGAAPGEVVAAVELHEGAGGFAGAVGNADFLGSAVVSVGDLDGDGVAELAVGAPGMDDGGSGRGAVWILFMNAGGTVASHQRISATHGGFTGALDDNDQFGQALAAPGDIDGDGVFDLAVGAHLDDDGGAERGAVWLLFLNANGTVKAHQKISATQGGFAGALADDDAFGIALASLADLDGNGTRELAVGAHGDDDGGLDRGAIWVLFLSSTGVVIDEQKISALHGGFAGVLDDGDRFGISLAAIHDLDGNGHADMAVGAHQDDDGGPERGAVWLLHLDVNANVIAEQKISATQGGFAGVLDDGDLFGRALTAVGDLDGNGFGDLAVGASQDDDGGSARGAVWILFLDAFATVVDEQKISATAGLFAGPLANGDRFASALGTATDLDGDERPELLAGSIFDAGAGVLEGAAWVLFLDAAVCGDTLVEYAETCDDGGNESGDGCSATCQLEAAAPVAVPSASSLGIALLCALIVLTGVRHGGPGARI